MNRSSHLGLACNGGTCRLFGEFPSLRGAHSALSVSPARQILADDMGLGKTVQVIALITAVLGKTNTSRDNPRMSSLNAGLCYSRQTPPTPSMLMNRCWTHNTTDAYSQRKRQRRDAGAEDGKKHVLVVCPKVVLQNWREEMNNWSFLKVRGRGGRVSLCILCRLARQSRKRRFVHNPNE
jgi:SNF2 family DNA or RNA helicase